MYSHKMKELERERKEKKGKLDDDQWVEKSVEVDSDAADKVKLNYPTAGFPLKGKRFTIPFGSFFVFNARKYLHGGGPGTGAGKNYRLHFYAPVFPTGVTKTSPDYTDSTYSVNAYGWIGPTAQLASLFQPGPSFVPNPAQPKSSAAQPGPSNMI